MRAKSQSKDNWRVLEQVHLKVNGQMEAKVQEAREEGRRLLSPQVLLVDDDCSDLELSAVPLRKFGCDVFMARDLATVRALVGSRTGSGRGYPFDLIFVDMKLSGGEDGSDVVRCLGRLAPRVPQVVLTGYPGCVSLEKICGEFTLVVITKPLTENHVRRLLDQFSIPYVKPVADDDSPTKL